MGILIFVLIINLLAVTAMVMLVAKASHKRKKPKKLKKPDYNYLSWLEDKWEDKEDK